MKWYWKVLKNYAVFSGRAQRKEFWYFILFNYLTIYVFAIAADYATHGSYLKTAISILLVIYVFAVFIPGIAVYVRRLHDTGRSGWWFLIILVPFGVFVLLVFLVEDSQADENKYGPNPKEEKISLPEEREK